MKHNWKGVSIDAARIDYDFLLMTHIQKISEQTSKLPHEIVSDNYSNSVGTTYADIVQSYCNMVEQLAQMLKPYWDTPYKNNRATDLNNFKTANEQFGHLIELCDRKQFLLRKTRVRASAEDSDVELPTYPTPETENAGAGDVQPNPDNGS